MGSCGLVFLLLTVFMKTEESQAGYRCREPVDIALLLDSSNCDGPQSFEKQKTFAKKFSTRFELDWGQLDPRFGIISYSDRIINVTNFLRSKTLSLLSSSLDKLRCYQSSRARLDLALKEATEFLLNSSQNDYVRPWTRHVVLAITDASSFWDQDLKNRIKSGASAVRAQVDRLVIAFIGQARPSNRRVLKSFGIWNLSRPYELSQVADKMAQHICPVPRPFRCRSKVDVAFIIDSSNSINNADYGKIKYFVYSIARALNLSENGAHFGVVIYSEYATTKIKFTDHKNIETFQKAVNRLKHMKKTTRIDQGLIEAHTTLFSERYGGARPGVKKLAFVLTDGKQNPQDKKVKVSLASIAKKLIDDGIKILSIGIGSDVDRKELRSIVQYNEDFIRADNYDELISKIQNVSQISCEIITYTECAYPADFIYVLDTSNDVKLADFQQVKEFVKTMARLFRISSSGSRGAVIVYGYRADLPIKMTDHVNYSSFAKAVHSLSPVGGRRRMYRALELAVDVLLAPNGGTRRKVPKVVLLLTAGSESNSQDIEDLKREAQRLRDLNVFLVGLGIGPSLNTPELISMVNSSLNLYLAKSFSKIKDELILLTNKTCETVGLPFCEDEVDIVFILDSSGSIDESDFSQAKEFVKTIAKSFKISPRGIRVALMIYSDQATVESRFGKIKSQEDLETELENLPHHKGKTRIDLALKLANTEVFSRNGGMRSSSSVKKVAVVITDGRQSPAPDEIRLDEAAAPLLFLGVKVLSIGVGDKIDISELKMMVENPEKDAFWSESYPALRLQLATIAREICSHKIYAM